MALVAGSGLLALLLDLAAVPAAWLLGPMAVAIATAARGTLLKVPPGLSVAAQALVGCLIAHTITPGVFSRLAADWPIFFLSTVLTILVSSGLGYLLARTRVVPGSVAVWGSAPGGATAMVIMAQAWGADARLVAVMVYLRVVMVAALASVVALVFTGHIVQRPLIFEWQVGPDSHGAALTLAVAGAGIAVGHWLRLPAGALICTMTIGSVLNLTNIAIVDPPRLVMIAAYAVIGWRIGLSFDRDTMMTSVRALPRLILACAVLLAFGGMMAALLVHFADVDPLTAYLATSPGGMDAVAVIASTSAADAPFVMALQVLRFVMIMIVGPSLIIRLANAAAKRASR